MMYCERCGAAIPHGITTCPQCGAPAPIQRPADPWNTPANTAPPAQHMPQQAPAPPPYAAPYAAGPAPSQPGYQQPLPPQAPPAQGAAPPYGNRPVQQPPQANANLAPVLGSGQYMLMMIITAIPLVGFIMLLVWAFSKGENPNRKNFAKANLFFMLIGVGCLVLLTMCSLALGGMLYNRL